MDILLDQESNQSIYKKEQSLPFLEEEDSIWALRWTKASPYKFIGTPQMLMKDFPDLSQNSNSQTVFDILKMQTTSKGDDSHMDSTDLNCQTDFQDSSLDLQKSARTCCNCPNSKCLKLYCICLQKGDYCGQDCKCKECRNTVLFEEKRQTVLNGEKYKNLYQGCKCKRSKCQLKYCECHLNGKKCGPKCKCKSCKNK